MSADGTLRKCRLRRVTAVFRLRADLSTSRPRAAHVLLEAVLFCGGGVDPAGEARSAMRDIGRAARRTGRPPPENPKGRGAFSPPPPENGCFAARAPPR